MAKEKGVRKFGGKKFRQYLGFDDKEKAENVKQDLKKDYNVRIVPYKKGRKTFHRVWLRGKKKGSEMKLPHT